MYKKIIFVILTISASSAGFFLISPQSATLIEISPQSTPNLKNHYQSPPLAMTPSTETYSNTEDFISAMVRGLIEQHLHEIHLLRVQVTMQDFRDFVIEQYPNNGASIFDIIIQRAFPDHANDILALINKLDRYDLWYADNLLDLNDLDALTKNGTIWQKRHELFGHLAEEIWHKEIQSQEHKRQTVQQTLDTLNHAKDMSLQERLFILQNTLDELYPDEQTNFTMNKGLISNVYFQLESVQENLASMTSDERQAAISQSRKQLGFSEKDIEALALEDQQKEQRWQNGYQYMSARDQMSQRYTGAELSEKIIELRERYFKNEAPTIAAEEESGFYRYKRPRLYGSN
ncbi:MAG: hypothetical protein ACI8SR_000097 [Oceanicoccus sp.]|jgi:hypothetical protein